MPKGLKITDLIIGTGPAAERGHTVHIRSRITLNRGDDLGTCETTFRIGDREIIAGLNYGVVGMQLGGTRRLRVSPHLAYGEKGAGTVPGNAVLILEVELLGVVGIPTPLTTL